MDSSTIVSIVSGIILAVIIGLQRRSTNLKVKGVTDTHANLNARIRDLEIDLEASNTRTDQANQEAGRLKSRIEVLETQVEQLKKEKEEERTRAEKVTEERDHQTKLAGQLAVDLAAERKNTNELEKRIRTLEDNVRDLKRQLEVNADVSKSMDQLAEKLSTTIVDKFTTAIHALVPIAPPATPS